MEKFVWTIPVKKRPELPIDKHLGDIVALVRKHQVVILCSPTGTGKTTVVPLATMQEFPEADILITQHRRLMVRRNGERMAELVQDRPGGLVGWRLSREMPMVSPDTRIKLLMEQSLINQMRDRKGVLSKGIVFMDEVHGRRKQTDMLFGLFKQSLADSPETRLVIMSATINAQEISEFFDGAPIYDVTAPRMFPVETIVHRLARQEHHSEGALNCATKVMDEFLASGIDLPGSNGYGREVVTEATVFVILPGKDDIANVRGALESRAAAKEANGRLEFFSLHGETAREEQDAAFAPIRKGVLRFVIGTEILREGITHTSLIVLIDSLEKKRKIKNAQGIGGLDKLPVSKAETQQALGRLGRVRSGRHYVVSFGSEYENLRDFPVPEISVSPITEVALGIAAIGKNIRTFPLITRPSDQQIDVAIKRLQRVGGLDENERITSRGHLLVRFPVEEPERAVTFLEAHQRGVLPEAVIALAAMEGEGFFHAPSKNHKMERLVWDMDQVRFMMSHLEKRSYRDSFDYSQKQLRDPKEEDLSVLPEWIKPLGEDEYEIDFDNYNFPFEHDLRGLMSFEMKRWAAGSTQNDFAAIVAAYRGYKNAQRRYIQLEREAREDRRRDKFVPKVNAFKLLRDWCFNHFINAKRIEVIDTQVEEILESVEDSGLDLGAPIFRQREFSADDLAKSLVAGSLDNVATYGGRNYNSALGEFSLANESRVSSNSPLIMVGGIRKVPFIKRGGTDFFFLGTMAIKLQPEWLFEIAPQLCKKQRMGDYQYDEKQDLITETEKRYYLSLLLEEQRIPAIHPVACAQTFAKWVGQSMASDYAYQPKKIRNNTDRFLAVKAWNAAYNKFSKQLVVRAGFEVVPTLTAAEWTKFFLENFPGVTRVNNLHDFAILRYPAPDAKEICEVLDKNPLKLRVIEGQPEGDVVYREGRQPSITLSYNREDLGWLRLPDEGVFLPSGQSISLTLYFSDGTGSVDDSDIPKLKEKAKDVLNLRQWYNWKESERPTIAAPTAAEDTAQVPEVVQAIYGKCVITGSDLAAYGTVVWNSNRYYSSDPLFKIEWCRNREEAETKNSQAKAQFEKMKAEAREKRQREQAYNEAKQWQERVSSFYSRTSYGSLDHSAWNEGLRSQCYELRNRSLYSSTESDALKAFSVEAQLFLRKAESLEAEVKAKKEAEERKRREQAERLEQYLQRYYTKTDFYELDSVSVGYVNEVYPEHELYRALVDSVNDAEGNPVPLIVTKVNGQDAVWLSASFYRRSSDVVLYIYRNEEIEIPVDEGSIKVQTVWFSPSAENLAVRALEEEVLTLKGELINLEEYELPKARTAYQEAEAKWLEREEAKAGTSPVEEGTIFLVNSFKKEEFKDQENLVAGPAYDWASGKQIKLILDPFSNASSKVTEESKDLLVRARPRSGSQLELFQNAFLRPIDGGQKQSTDGYFVVCIPDPKVLEQQIQELEEKLKITETDLEAARMKAEKARAEVREQFISVPDEHRFTRKTVETVIDYSSRGDDSFVTLGDAIKVTQVVTPEGESGEAVNIPQNYLAPGGETTFVHFEKRDFKCQREGCGAFVSLTASEMRGYKAGSFSKAVECPKCHATGTINS